MHDEDRSTSPEPSGATPTARTPTSTSQAAPAAPGTPETAPESNESVVPGTALSMPDPEPEGGTPGTSSGLGYHQVDWSGKTMFQCDRCSYNSFTESRMTPHVRSHR